MSKKALRVLSVLTIIAAALLAGSGCSRSMINYQVAESIGTVGDYDNNEPVETPKMQAQRELEESEARVEAEREELLDEADALAESYFYEEAIALLENSELLTDDERADKALSSYRSLENSMYAYEGTIGNLCFPNLIVDTRMALDDDDYAQTYEQNLITLDEFEAILNELYANGFVLVDLHMVARETENEAGKTEMTQETLMMPAGKKPLVLSVENLNYASIRSGDGIATKLVLDEDGEVAAVYTDDDGHERTGAYDVVPAVEQFIAEHPDFSYRGARGIISVSGSGGAFGYQVEESKDAAYERNRETVTAIADKLLEDGWTLASAGYSYAYMNDMSYEQLEEDIEQWEEVIGSLIGGSDTLLYPYGSEVDYESEKADYLLDEGFRYLVGLWASDDYLAVNESYLRQTRRAITGYVLENYASYFSSYFSVPEILDSAR